MENKSGARHVLMTHAGVSELTEIGAAHSLDRFCGWDNAVLTNRGRRAKVPRLWHAGTPQCVRLLVRARIPVSICTSPESFTSMTSAMTAIFAGKRDWVGKTDTIFGPMHNRKPKLFLSHAWEDKEAIADKLCQVLNNKF
jgi:hypothetical protein